METKSKTDVSVMAEPRMIPIGLVKPDPNQPRKTFDEAKLNELANSIKAKNILQPLLLRPDPEGKGYIIVFGERRYRAALILGLKEVPAIIKDLSDQEVRQIQIIENVQREDLHPMQQAEGFLDLITDGKMTHDDIAANIGKSVHYVRQQLKLNNLIPKWQKMFLKNGISLTTALAICVLPDESQRDIYNGHVNAEDEKSTSPYIQINTSLINKFKGDLSTACFDPTDANLVVKAGACTVCVHNSSVSSLFAGQEKNPICNNILCFLNKSLNYTTRELAKIKDDPNMIIGYTDYHMPAVLQKYKDDGFDVMRIGYSDDARQVQQPQLPVWEKFVKENAYRKLSDKKMKEAFNEDVETVKFQIETFNKNVASGKYKKAFLVQTKNEDICGGAYIFVQLNEKQESKTKKKQIDDNSSAEDIAKEIKRIETREDRCRELDQEKIQRRIAEAVKDDKSFETVPKQSTPFDQLFTNFLLLELIPVQFRGHVEKVLKISGFWGAKDSKQFEKTLSSLTKPQITFLQRIIIKYKYSNSLPTTNEGRIFKLMAATLKTIPIIDFEKEQNERALLRQGKVTDRIQGLKKMKNDLKKEGGNNKTSVQKKPTKKIEYKKDIKKRA